MKKLSFLFIILTLLNSCRINNNIKDRRELFCYSSYRNQSVLKLDSNNIFEAEKFIQTVGTRHYYCKGKWSYVSKNIIMFECDEAQENLKKVAWRIGSVPLGWNPHFDKAYIKVISKNKVILFSEVYEKVILKSKRCDCMPERILGHSIILDTTNTAPKTARKSK